MSDPTAGVDPAIVQRAVDGLVRNEPKAITVVAMTALGIDPIRAAAIYDYVKANAITGVDLVKRDVSNIATGWLKALIPILKIAAGGAGLLVTGIALVYIAGRNTAGGRAVTGGTDAASTAARKVAGPVVRRRNRTSTVSDEEYFERRGMERAARQTGSPRPRSIKGVGGALPRKRKAAS